MSDWEWWLGEPREEAFPSGGCTVEREAERVFEAVLTAERRGELADSDFAVPGKRLLPIHDEEHARLAWNEVNRTHGLSEYEREEAKHNIMRALHRMGVKFRSRRGSAGEGMSGESADDGALERAPRESGDVAEASSGWTATEDGQVVVGDVAEAVVADDAGHVIEVTIVRPGVSQNGYIYTEDVLRGAVPLWEGAPAFLDHPTALDLTRAGARSLRDLVGVYEGARYESGPSGHPGIRARLRLLPNDHGVFETVRESVKLTSSGRAAPPIGISADWRLLKAPAPAGADGRPRWQVHSIVAVNSGDVVVRPSAGGTFDRILESIRDSDLGGVELVETEARERGDAEARRVETTVKQPSAGVFEQGVLARPVGATRALEAQSDQSVQASIEAALEPYKRALAASTLDAKLQASGLPEPAKKVLQQQFLGRVFEASELDSAIGGLKQMLGEVFGQSAIRGVGSVLDPGRVQGITPLEKMQAAFDRLFGLEVPAHLTGVPRLTGIREAYVAITGDKFFTGQYHWEESVVREANETTTSVLSNVVLNSMTKRLIKDYQAQPKCSTSIPKLIARLLGWLIGEGILRALSK